MKRYLVLENGAVFAGEAFGADREVTAEIVFTTAMVGYVESLTDVSYRGQILCQTFPLGGNYGVCLADAETEGFGPAGFIVRECAEIPSNFRSDISLDEFLKQNGIPGLKGIDTRALTKMLRENGTMNGTITSDPASVDMDAVKAFRMEKPVADVSSTEETVVNPDGKFTVALYDYGRKNQIVRALAERNCKVHILPYNTPAERVLEIQPDGLLLSNGPGNPAENTEVIENLKKLVNAGIPTMGICLGHQLLALANGFKTEKLPYGHRGASQPVRNEETGHLYVTSQNHGYTVDSASVNGEVAKAYFTNVNDNTNEGLIYTNRKAFSVQFVPQCCTGPTDTSYLYDRFVDMMKAEN